MSICSALVIDLDWNGWTCLDRPSVTGRASVWNAITGLQPREVEHHSIWQQFVPWSGTLLQKNILVDFLGFHCPFEVFCRFRDSDHDAGEAYADAIRMRLCSAHKKLLDIATPRLNISLRWPVISEEYFEYVDILDAAYMYVGEVLSSTQNSPGRPFTVVDLGAGFGYWTFAAHMALRQIAKRSGMENTIQYRYILVDVVNTEEIIHALAKLNGIGLNSQNGQLTFHLGFVTASGGFEAFGHASSSYAKKMVQWYSPAWLTPTRSEALPAVSLKQLMVSQDMSCVVDFMDIDIQGGEYALLMTNATIELLTRRVKRIHIGLHSQVKQRDMLLMVRFQNHGWQKKWLWHSNLVDNVLRKTYWGPVVFYDGVLSMVNSRIRLGEDCKSAYS